jgi:hypothetical protein
VGLVLLARYREERFKGARVDDALAVGVAGASLGTLGAALAASVAYGSLIATEFRGFRQFGCIGSVGMLSSWITAFVLVPPLLKWLDRGPMARPAKPRRREAMSLRLLAAVERGAPLIVAGAVGLAALSAFAVSRFDASHIEYDFNKLRRVDTWKTGEGYWGRKMDAILGHYVTPTVILCDTPEQARAVEASVRKSVESGTLAPFVDQPAKIALTAQIRQALTPKIRSLVDSDTRTKIDRIVGHGDLTPIRAGDLPASLTTGLREADGSIGRSILVYPRPSDALWKADTMHLFVTTLRSLAAAASPADVSAVRVAGSIPLSGDILTSLARDAPIASLVSLFGVVAVVVVILRARKASAYVIGSLLLGILLLAGATMAFGIKINFSNFIAFPITLGIGADYSVNVMTRYVQDGERDVAGAVRATGGAVALCSLTTIIGYSSLLLAKNHALFLFGLIAVTGEIACLSAAVIVLPAWLVLQGRLGTMRRSARSSALANL